MPSSTLTSFSEAGSSGIDLAGKGDKEEGLTASEVSGTKGLSLGFGSAADCSVCSQTFPPLLWEVDKALCGFLLETGGCDLADDSFSFLAVWNLPIDVINGKVLSNKHELKLMHLFVQWVKDLITLY